MLNRNPPLDPDEEWFVAPATTLQPVVREEPWDHELRLEPTDPRLRDLFWIVSAARRANHALAKRLKPIGLTVHEFETLAALGWLARSRMPGQSEVAEHALLDEPIVSKSITALERRQLIERALYHRRSKRIAFTSEGYALLKQANEIADVVDQELEANTFAALKQRLSRP
jgi:DNA-binding MarR family transcriptional regulator